MRHVLGHAAACAAMLAAGSVSLLAQASADSSLSVKFGGFVDAYYAFDFNRPRTMDRAYTTQPARHNEFNVNLAYVEAVLSGARVRGRVALQLGTSVQSNYAAEPRVGTVSGSDVSRYIQEAVVGVKVAPSLWVDGGIYLSHIGSESWISRDNLTYTRSLIADFSPYYQAGVKVTWQATPSLTAQLNVVNGWQNISETNGDKAVGGRVDWVASPKATFFAYNLIGNEAPDTVASRLRLFQGMGVKWTPNARLILTGTFDVGSQDGDEKTARWHGASLIARLQATSGTAVVARVEQYSDPQQVLIVTRSDRPFMATGGSLGVDLTPAPRMSWRTELRTLVGRNAIFPANDGAPKKGNTFFVSSLALSF